MNPTPVTMPANACGLAWPVTAAAEAAAEPMRANVRSPAGEPRSSRSKPIRKARAKPTRIRLNSSVSLSDRTGLIVSSTGPTTAAIGR
jgi:hypothetical protein